MSDLITRLNAALSGRYRIERELGHGGMATVYLADDLRHERRVALKVLKSELAVVVGAERFLSEIKTTANLQHPHIVPLFDSGEADSFLFYVMPYVVGESLRARLDREGQLPVPEAVGIASDLAEALDYAHAQGVIHRDIKPANILLQASKPMIADFGIALALSAGGGDRLTETGLSLGTPHYMSPEQATGDLHVGAAADTYALGCVLYEMLVGEPPYTGSTPHAILGKIIGGDPPRPRAQRPLVPANVDAAVTTALERLPADRFSSGAAFVAALRDPAFRWAGESDRPSRPEAVWKSRASLIGVGIALLVAAAAGWMRSPSPQPEMRLRLALPLEQGMELRSNRSRLALSPDGSSFVYSGLGPAGSWQLWKRRLDELEATPIEGSIGGHNPFFSPDGTDLGFAVGSMTLRVVSLTGGPAVTIADSVVGNAGTTWGVDGYLYTDGVGAAPLYRLRPVAGTAIEPASTIMRERGETNHIWPDALPNGRGLLFTVDYGGARPQDIAVLDLRTGTHRVLLRGSFPRYAATGHVLYVTDEGTLMAAPFDQGRLALAGDPAPIAEGLELRLGRAADVTISDTGTLMYTTRSDVEVASELVWVDRVGSTSVIERSAGQFFAPRISPDGRRIAVGLTVPGGENNIWIKSLPDGPFTQFTLEDGSQPAWSPDGQRIAFSSRRVALSDLFAREVDGTSEAVPLWDGTGLMFSPTYSPDGRWMAYWEGADVYVAEMGSALSERRTVATGVGDGSGIAISPNGRWIAYGSTESGSDEIFVAPAPFPAPSNTRWSLGPGSYPVWSKDGGELFFRNGTGVLVAVPIGGEQSLVFGEPVELFPTYGFSPLFDVARDGARFVMARQAQGSPAPDIILALNFARRLEQLRPN